MTAESEIYEAIWRDKSGRTFAQRHGARPRFARAAEYVRRFPGGRLLDVGCGDGALCQAVRGEFAEVRGVEISEQAAALCRTCGVETDVVNLNTEPLPCPDGHYDTIACLDVIEHVFDPHRLLDELARALRPGGGLVISTVNIRHLGHLARLVVLGRFPRTSGDPQAYDGGHLHYFTYADLEALLARHGFTDVQRGGFGESRWVRWSPALCRLRPVREFLTAGLLLTARRA